jgi:hypothetical protein
VGDLDTLISLEIMVSSVEGRPSFKNQDKNYKISYKKVSHTLDGDGEGETLGEGSV